VRLELKKRGAGETNFFLRPERAKYDSPGQSESASAALGKLPLKTQALSGRNKLNPAASRVYSGGGLGDFRILPHTRRGENPVIAGIWRVGLAAYVAGTNF
jgi:hypothetical protein